MKEKCKERKEKLPKDVLVAPTKPGVLNSPGWVMLWTAGKKIAMEQSKHFEMIKEINRIECSVCPILHTYGRNIL